MPTHVLSARFPYLVGRWTQLRTNISRSTARPTASHHLSFALLGNLIAENFPIASFTKSSSSSSSAATAVATLLLQTCSHASDAQYAPHTFILSAPPFLIFLIQSSATTIRRRKVIHLRRKIVYSFIALANIFCISFFAQTKCDVNRGDERQDSRVSAFLAILIIEFECTRTLTTTTAIHFEFD